MRGVVLTRLLAGLATALSLAVPARAEPPVWVVKDADSELVLFGSIHVLPPGLKWRPATLDAALGKADDLWFELPVDPVAEQLTAQLAASKGVLPPDQSLFAMLPPKDAERLIRIAKAYGVDRLTLDRLKPWLAEVALAAAVYAKSGADSAYGVENVLSATAPQAERQAFETPAEQIGLFDQASQADQIASLRETLNEIEADPQVFQKLIQGWLAGDVSALTREIDTMQRASPVLFRRLVTERNARWTTALDIRLKRSGRTVVVVGAGHLVGPEGVPARLRALGYSVSGP